MIKSVSYKLFITFTQPVLGGQPGRDTPASDYLKEKVKKENPEAPVEEDAINLPDELQKGTTGFYRDENGKPIFKSYQIKGLIKECGDVLNGIGGMKAMKSKLDNLLFVTPVNISIKNLPDGNLGIVERPLRAMTREGPRTSLARSEMIPAGTSIECELKVIETSKTEIPEEILRDLLDYGTQKGFLQWRNSGVYGGFTYELVKM